jgi:hypothetical protein
MEGRLHDSLRLGGGNAGLQRLKAGSQCKKLVCDIQGCENGNAKAVHRSSVRRDGPHLAVDYIRKALDVSGIGPAKLINLIVNFNDDGAGIARLQFGSRDLCRGPRGLQLCHFYCSCFFCCYNNSSRFASIASTRTRTDSRSFFKLSISVLASPEEASFSFSSAISW